MFILFSSFSYCLVRQIYVFQQSVQVSISLITIIMPSTLLWTMIVLVIEQGAGVQMKHCLYPTPFTNKIYLGTLSQLKKSWRFFLFVDFCRPCRRDRSSTATTTTTNDKPKHEHRYNPAQYTNNSKQRIFVFLLR